MDNFGNWTLKTGFFGVQLDRLCINKRVVRLEPEIKDEL